MINQQLFNNIKKMIPALKWEISYDKTHHFNIQKDTDFMSPNDNNTDLSLIDNIFSNPIIHLATNINRFYKSSNHDITEISGIILNYNNSTRNLDIVDVLHVINRLVKLGRIGIDNRAKHNQMLKDKIAKLNRAMMLR